MAREANGILKSKSKWQGRKGRSGKGSGGKREGAGRKPGGSNPSTLEFRNHAREFTIRAIDLYVEVMENTKNPLPLRMEAANWLIERGHGRPQQNVAIEPENQTTVQFNTFEDVKIALLEEGIDFDRLPMPRLIDDAHSN